MAMIGLGATLAFTLWNFPPAKVYLGTSGSWFLGLYIGIIAIVSGGKIVTTLLVLAIPVIDFISVIIQRLFARQKPWQGDTTHHLHHRLLTAGLTSHQILIMAIMFSAILSYAAITMQTSQKIIAFFIAAAMLILISLQLIWVQKKSR